MALPTKLSSNDVKGWARGKLKATGRAAVKASKKKPGKAKPPVDDPRKTAQPAPQTGEQEADGPEGTAPLAKKPNGKANTEPLDPMNAGGPELPEELMEELRQDPDDEEVEEDEEEFVDPAAAELEEKLGDFAEVLEHRASELEELAAEVEGDLTGEEVDLATTREVQALIPDDLRQDLVEHLSALTPEEVDQFCAYLQEQGRVEDGELVAAFLRAAASDSSEEMEEDEEVLGDEEDEDEEAEGEESGEFEEDEDEEPETGEDEEEADDEGEEEDDEEEPPPSKKSKKPPKFKPKGKPAKKVTK